MKDLHREKIWDPVTRTWHWVLVISMFLNWIFGEFMSFDTVTWHFYTGYLILGLMGFRILWGLAGPVPIRISTLVPTPSFILQYLKTVHLRTPSGTPGHNPLGSLSVIVMLALITAVGITGLFIESEDFFEIGPLYRYVSSDTVKSMLAWHHTLSDLMLILIGLHIFAIIYYLLWKGENLIKPMINGWKWVKRDK